MRCLLLWRLAKRKGLKGILTLLFWKAKSRLLSAPCSPINYCLMLIKERGGWVHVMKHNYSLQHFPSTSFAPPPPLSPLVLSEEAASAVSWVQQAKMSPQPFKEGTGGSRVKGAICPSDIWGETAIYVRSCWKTDRRSRHITLQPFIGWAHSLTWTANTVAQQRQLFFFVCLLYMYVRACECACVSGLHILDWHVCVHIDECRTVVNMLWVAFYKLADAVGSYFNKTVAPQTRPTRVLLSDGRSTRGWFPMHERSIWRA